MTRDEAQRRASELQAEHEDRDTHRFVARPAADGEWEVAKVTVPEQLRCRPLEPTVEARPRPPHADDPRSGHEQRAPGTAGGIF